MVSFQWLRLGTFPGIMLLGVYNAFVNP